MLNPNAMVWFGFQFGSDFPKLIDTLIFSDLNALSHLDVHSKSDSFLNILEKCNAYWVDFAMRIFKEVNIPFSF